MPKSKVIQDNGITKDILIFGTNYEIEKSKEYAKEKIPQFKNK